MYIMYELVNKGIRRRQLQGCYIDPLNRLNRDVRSFKCSGASRMPFDTRSFLHLRSHLFSVLPPPLTPLSLKKKWPKLRRSRALRTSLVCTSLPLSFSLAKHSQFSRFLDGWCLRRMLFHPILIFMLLTSLFIRLLPRPALRPSNVLSSLSRTRMKWFVEQSLLVLCLC